jgi:cbb3-type cytochrome oxidase subunit 1
VDWFVRRFIKSALAWLGLGVSMGVAMAAHPLWTIYRPAHVHMNLLGFVTMMIFGVGYHVLPRFFGHPLHSRKLAGVHWWLSNAGLALMVLGFFMAPHVGARSVPVLATGGALSAFGAFAFIFNIWRTIDGPTALRRIAEVPASRRPPLAPGDS